MKKVLVVYSKVWFNTPRLAAAVNKQRKQRIGIKPDGPPIERASDRNNATLRILRGLPRGGSFVLRGLIPKNPLARGSFRALKRVLNPYPMRTNTSPDCRSDFRARYLIGAVPEIPKLWQKQ